MAFAPRRPLLGVPSSSIMAGVDGHLFGGVKPHSASAISPLTAATAFSTPLPM
jgi:hypothetical protein